MSRPRPLRKRDRVSALLIDPRTNTERRFKGRIVSIDREDFLYGVDFGPSTHWLERHEIRLLPYQRPTKGARR